MLITKQEHREGSIYCYTHKYQKDKAGNLLLKEKKKKVLAFRVDIPINHDLRGRKDNYGYRIMSGYDDITTLSAIISTVSRLSKQWRENGAYDRYGKLALFGRC